MKLLNEQKKSKEKLSKMKVGAFFMDAGTGKTRSVIETIKNINSDLIIWFTPFQTKDNLRKEIDRWGFKNVHIEGVESIQNSDRKYLNIHKMINNSHKPVIVVDESLKIKNAESKRTKRVIELGKMVDYKYIMNGTPLSRDLLDLWSQMNFLSPKILNMSMVEFKNNFCEYKSLTIKKGRLVRSKEWIVKYHNLHYLYQLIEPYIFECNLKIDVKKQYVNINYSLDSKTKIKYQKIIDKVLDNEWLMAKPNFFIELTQKLQNSYSRSEEKFDIVRDVIDENGYDKILIFAKYIKTQNELKKRFPNVKVLSYQKHSFGLNLQPYSRTIFFDKHWDYSLREQAERRTYRFGQKHDCVYYDLTGNVGLDTLISDNCNKKSELLKEFKKLSLEQFKIKIQ